MSKIDKAQTVMNWIAGAAGLYFVSIAIAGAVKRKREQGTHGVGVITATGNEKTTIREAWKNREFKNEAWVIFKDIEEPKGNQVWIIKEYDRSEREYYLINWDDTSREKWVKGDKVCFTGFYF